MIKNRIAATAALAAFALAGLAGTALAGPASADSGTSSAASPSGTSSSSSAPTSSSAASPSAASGTRGEQTTSGVRPSLSTKIANQNAQIQAQLGQLQDNGAVSVADMFEQQMSMNRLSQLSEMSASVVSASNSAIASMARGIKS